jgi:hypothetical protein
MTSRGLRRFGHWLIWTGLAGLSLTLAGGWVGLGDPEGPRAADLFWRIGEPASIAVRDGRASFRVPTTGPSSEVLVVVSALSRAGGTFPIRITARSADHASVPILAGDQRSRTPVKRAAQTPRPLKRQPRRGLPPRERLFSMMVRDGDAGSPSNYTSIRGVLKGVGHQLQVYVASEDVADVDQALVKDLITTFDDRIHPLAATRFGEARDVDGDGRFTILLSSWLDRLGNGRHAVDGFVRVADLDPAFTSPFGNQCDMMYLSTALKSGPYVRTVLAHEYMHAVIFSQKLPSGRQSASPVLEEEGWLDEAIAHLAEDLYGFSTSNIDYRVSAFLSWPERYQLVVDDYYAANLFRSHGNRGSTYLFLRWCADRHGPDLLPALVSSSRRGTANLESATGSSFASLFRMWSLALYLSGLEPGLPDRALSDEGYRVMDLRSPHEEWELAGPRYERLSPDGSAHRWSAAGTSSHYVVVDGSRSSAVEIEVAGAPGAQLQVTALPLGSALASLDLSLFKSTGPEGELRVRARVRERHGVQVQLSALSWEPLVPSANPRAAGVRHGRLDMLGIAATFGTSLIPADGELRSQPICLPGVSSQTGPVVVKVIGTDANGRRIAAWAEVNSEPDTQLTEP